MFEMWRSSVVLFLQGKLFRDRGAVARQTAIGVVATAAACFALSRAVPLWAAAAIAGAAGGFLQPWLFRNLKYQ